MNEAANILRRKRPGFEPKVAVILGSGLAQVAENATDALAISYAELPGFAPTGVDGHVARLVTGFVGKTPVAFLQGRIHYYEKGDAGAMKATIRALHAMGAETLIVTNAAGSLDPAVGPGSVLMITDHINLVQRSPLFGETGNERFVDMVGAYDSGLAARARSAALSLNLDLFDGVYVWFAGPQFETPAEIRMARLIGGTAVGMSSVPEVIVARQLRMRVAGFSIITNLGAGMSEEILSHEHTMSHAGIAAEKLCRILLRMIEGMSS